MINLLPKNEINKIKRFAYQRAVYLVTTWVLIAYIAGLTSLAGWWFFLDKNDIQASSEVVSLTTQLSQLAAKEVMVNEYRSRLKIVDEAIKNHVFLSSDLAKILPSSSVVISGWDYKGKAHTISILASDAATLQNYVDGLKASFPKSVVTSLSSKDNQVWEINLQTNKL